MTTMNIQANIAHILENFDLLEDWEEKYAYIIELGKKLPPMPEVYKVDHYKVKGCVSNVWLYIYKNATNDNVIHFLCDSDAFIVKGLLYILFSIFDGQLLEDVKQVDINKILQKIGFENMLTPSRINGFFAVAEKIQKYQCDD